MLKADATNLPAITLGHAENLQVGDVVLAIGNPFGFGNTVTAGIVSALGRNFLGVNQFEDFIQTDAAINPGNSGGALIDTAGNLIGINSTIFSQTGSSNGIAFSIPVSLAKTVFEQIIRDGEVTRGWFGIEPQSLTSDLAQSLALTGNDGVLIRSMQRGGPAESAGVLAGDVVVEVGRQSHAQRAAAAGAHRRIAARLERQGAPGPAGQARRHRREGGQAAQAGGTVIQGRHDPAATSISRSPRPRRRRHPR